MANDPLSSRHGLEVLHCKTWLQGWFSRPHFQSMHGDLLISSVSEGMETRNLNERRAQESIAIFGVMAAKV